MSSSVHQGHQESKRSKPVGSLIHDLLHYHIELCCLSYMLFNICFSPLSYYGYTLYYISHIKFYTMNSRKHCNTYYTTYYTTYYIYIYMYIPCYILCCVLYCMLGYILLKKYTLPYTALQNNAILYQCHVNFRYKVHIRLMYYLRDRNYVLSCCAAYVVLRIYSCKHCCYYATLHVFRLYICHYVIMDHTI